MTDFRGCQGNERDTGRGNRGNRIPSVLLERDSDQEGVGQQNQGEVYVIWNRSGARYSQITYIIRIVTQEHSE